MSGPKVTVGKVQRGVAGEYRITAEVTYPDEPMDRVTFQGSSFGGPIVMITEGNPGGVFVSQRVTDRIGRTLTPTWVEAFFA